MKCLFVSIGFPPKSDPECIQSAKYFYYLAKSPEINFDVLTSRLPTLFMPFDPYLKKYDIGWKKKIELSIPENKYLNYFLRKFLPFGIDYPDSKYYFHWQWKKAIKLIRNAPDIIYSRSYPLSSTIMAYKLTNYYKVPWIMHLSDPWLLSPLHRLSGRNKRWHVKWEKRCFDKAEKICLTSKETLQLYQNHYPELKNKFVFFPNVFDSMKKPERPKQAENNILKITYTGGLTINRSIESLIPIFEDLKNSISDIDHKLKFVFAGPIDSYNRHLFKREKFSFIEYIGTVSYEEAIKLQQESDILLLIDNKFESHNEAIYFPSKLIDYIYMEKRILAITNLESTTHKILKKYKSNVFPHNDRKGIYYNIQHYLQQFSNKNSDYFKSNPPDKSYSAAYNSDRLIELMKKSWERRS